MRFTFAIVAVLPLLAHFTSVIAAPVQLVSDQVSVRALEDNTIDARGDTLLELASDINTRDVDDGSDALLESRANGSPYRVPQRKRVTAAAQQTRKSNVRKTVQQNQAKNAQKKATLRAMPPDRRYGKPRSAKKQPKNQPGYRAAGRALPPSHAGHRRPKQPKTPKPNMKKGDPRTEKSRVRQQAANARQRDRKAAGRAKFADARTQYGRTANLPGRKQVFKANGVKATGRDVRAAVFNTHHFNGNSKTSGKPSPKVFENRPQGPKFWKSRPLSNMKGPGKEFPVVPKKGGYQGGEVGTMRAITTSRDGRHKFKGVVAHDASRPTTHRGYNDHFKVKPQRNFLKRFSGKK